MNKAIFLDRDGVINHEFNYVYKVEDVIFTDGIFDLCRYFQSEGYIIIIITNQAGIARKYYTEDDFLKLTEWMISKFSNERITITDVFHCPHHPDINGICECRKPSPGMIIKASKKHNINLDESILIGDKISDIEAGRNAGISLNILIKPNLITQELLRLLK